MALLGAGGEAYRTLDVAQRVAACEASGAEVESAWSSERRHALHDGLVATGVSYAPTTAEKVTPWLERQAEAWREARVEACLDAEVRGRWDAETLERSLWCLDERRTQLQSLVDELVSADAVVVQKAVPAAAGLDSVDPCRDESLLAAMAPPPAESREAVRAVRMDVTRAGNLAQAGRYETGLELAHSALERAKALDWRPLEAEARHRLGILLEKAGRYAEAEKALEEAYFEAAGGVAPELAFVSAQLLVFAVGVDLRRYAEGRRWGRHAEVALASIRDGESLHRAGLLNNLGFTYVVSGAYDDARAHHERALAIFERALGPEHPLVATSLMNLAIACRRTGGYDEAKRLHERALAIREQVLGAEHPDVGQILMNLATVHVDTGAFEEAKRLYERALSVQEEALGPEHPEVALSLNNLGRVYFLTGAYEEARALFERALAIREHTLDAEHPDVGQSLNNLAAVHSRTGAYETAKRHYERALSIKEKKLGSAHPDLTYTLMGLAEVALAQRRPGEAVPLAQRAVVVRETADMPPRSLAEARFVLARALWDAPVDGGRDRARAVALAERARDVLRASGKRGAETLAEVEQWLRDRSDGR